METGADLVGLAGGLSATDGGATGHSLSARSSAEMRAGAAGWGGCGAGLFFPGAGCAGEHEASTSCDAAGSFTRDGTGGGGVLETLGRLTSEERREWEEPEHKEAELTEREGAGDGGREDTLEGTSGSAPRKRGRERGRERSGYREESDTDDPTKNRVFM